jgi:hypothetical protein
VSAQSGNDLTLMPSCHYFATMRTVSVRIPDDLHARAEQAAETDRRSLNAEILWLIEQGLNRQETPAAAPRPSRQAGE